MNGTFCVCCGYNTIAERGNFEICPICYWEDDILQEEYPDDSGANPISLRQAQNNFIEIGACENDMKRHTRLPYDNEERDPRWRLLDHNTSERTSE